MDVIPAPPPLPPPAPVVPLDSGWEVEFAPYGWIMYLDGTVTARGREVDVETDLFQILDEADLNGAWMSYLEARNGRWALYLDTIWTDIGYSREMLAQRNPVAGLTISARADVAMDFEMAVVEGGAAYEIARWSAPTPVVAPDGAGAFTALDLTGGARYWHLETTVNLDATVTVNLANLGLSRSASGVVEASGGADWTDPVVGLQLRHQFAPGSELTLAGDIGGFGVGSDFTWQVEGVYEWDIGEHAGHTWFGEVGYRALSVDYSDGAGNFRKGFDMLIHGPVAAVGMRW